MRMGFARVSTTDQNLDRQLDALEAAGCERIYAEKAGGALADRPELARMMDALRDGDTVVVTKLDRISRSTRHLIELAAEFEERGVDFVSLGDAIDTATPTGRFFFRMLASVAELERDLIVERTKEGLASARARGRCGGRPAADGEVIEKALVMYRSRQFTMPEITAACGISKSTVYKYAAMRGARPDELR